MGDVSSTVTVWTMGVADVVPLPNPWRGLTPCAWPTLVWFTVAGMESNTGKVVSGLVVVLGRSVVLLAVARVVVELLDVVVFGAW